MRVHRQNLAVLISCLFPAFLMSSCGGSAPTSGESTVFGSAGGVQYAIVGASQTPVVSAGSGSAVVGLAGASVTDISPVYAARILSSTRISFFTARDGNFEIYSMTNSGTDLQNVSNNVQSDQGPAWSPNGSKIAFKSFRDGQGEVYSMNSDGTSVLRLTNNVATDGDPSWSPDSAKIAFKSTRSGNNDIWTMNSSDGSGPLQLTSDVNTDQDPAWSPDGNLIAFASNRDGDFEIFTMNSSNGTGAVPLTANAFSDIHPSWSPDGTKIAFESNRDGNAEIYVMNSDGSSQVRLTNNANTDSFPNWSPDGSKIVFQTNRDGNFEIYTMNSSNGASLSRITNNTASDQSASWSTFLPPSKLVGTGGTMGTSCAGFLVGSAGAETTSVLTFDTPTLATRANSRVTANTNPDTNSPNLIFTITTSAGLSQIKYANLSSSPAPVSPVIPAGTTGAIVMFDSSTGLVSSVLAFTANRSIDRTIYSGETATFYGDFKGIFGSRGENLAQKGASSVTVNYKTGTLLNFH